MISPLFLRFLFLLDPGLDDFLSEGEEGGGGRYVFEGTFGWKVNVSTLNSSENIFRIITLRDVYIVLSYVEQFSRIESVSKLE